MTYEEAIRKFTYDPNTGDIKWRNAAGRWGRIPAGTKATSVDSKGYLYVHIYDPETRKSINIRAHRLIWLMVYKENPKETIDHINKIRTDNRLCNLRLATKSQQLFNTRIRSDNKCGATGVSPTRHGTYQARIWKNGKSQCLGTYKTIKEAKESYEKAKKELHKF